MLPYKLESVIISRTDSIGDVVLTLPLAGIIKREYPGCKIYFLGRSYTKALIEASVNVDVFINADDYPKSANLSKVLAKTKAQAIIHVYPDKKIVFAAQNADIPMRIGTSHRLYNLLGCNYPVNFSRKNSDLHEAELNLKLLQPFGLGNTFTKADLPHYYGLQKIETPDADALSLLDKTRFHLILHPLSKGSAREWSLDNFSKLIAHLPQNKFKLFVSGTADDGAKLNHFISQHSNSVTNITGLFSLPQFMGFIKAADGLVAASTGPLHIAAALGKHAVGIYPPTKPIHPGRWAPLGVNAKFFVDETDIYPKLPLQVKPEEVAEYLKGL